jgi:hypothetical protein
MMAISQENEKSNWWQDIERQNGSLSRMKRAAAAMSLTVDEASAELAKRGYSFKESPFRPGRTNVGSWDASGRRLGPIIYEWDLKRNTPKFPGIPECGAGRLEAVPDWLAYHDEIKRWPRHGGHAQDHLTMWERRALVPPDPRTLVRRRAKERYLEWWRQKNGLDPEDPPIWSRPDDD